MDSKATKRPVLARSVLDYDRPFCNSGLRQLNPLVLPLPFSLPAIRTIQLTIACPLRVAFMFMPVILHPENLFLLVFIRHALAHQCGTPE